MSDAVFDCGHTLGVLLKHAQIEEKKKLERHVKK